MLAAEGDKAEIDVAAAIEQHVLLAAREKQLKRPVLFVVVAAGREVEDGDKLVKGVQSAREQLKALGMGDGAVGVEVSLAAAHLCLPRRHVRSHAPLLLRLSPSHQKLQPGWTRCVPCPELARHSPLLRRVDLPTAPQPQIALRVLCSTHCAAAELPPRRMPVWKMRALPLSGRAMKSCRSWRLHPRLLGRVPRVLPSNSSSKMARRTAQAKRAVPWPAQS